MLDVKVDYFFVGLDDVFDANPEVIETNGTNAAVAIGRSAKALSVRRQKLVLKLLKRLTKPQDDQ